MSQNIYDDPGFFAGYAQLPRSLQGLEGAPEWASIRRMLPTLAGARIVDLGCGYGWFCRWARAQGAAAVLGLDLSEKMLARAAALTDDPAITYRRADLEAPDLPANAFDLAYSSLALHYIVDLPGLFAAVARALVPGGRFVASVEHPLLTAPSVQGWMTMADGRTVWPIDSYLLEGPRVTDWLAEGVVKQHRTAATYFRLLRDAGFTLTHLEEWQPDDAQVATQPALAQERQRPTFMLWAAQRA